MRGFLMFAGAMAVAGVAMAHVADRVAASPPVPPVASRAVHDGSKPARLFQISRDRRGHFLTEARVDGQRFSVMVDTGASTIALNESSAARIGIRPTPKDYTATVATANGSVRAARTQIARIEIGPVVVRDVDALVLPDSALSENLLGLSFLSKLKRYEFAGGTLVLEQ
jgi:aspartyl protease family protein